MLMEFELDRTQMKGFDALLDVTLRPEETLEMIVPDACPDILRIVETDGKVLLKSKEAMDGRVELMGMFQMSILYLPDGESGMRHLDVNIPFTCAAEGRDVSSACSVVAEARLCRADTRALNPRKVLVRAEAAVDVTVFSPRTETVCSRVLTGEGESVEQLTETQDIYLTACVQEKPFPFSDEVNLSAGKPAAAELLKSRVILAQGDSKIIGNKLIFKGSANISLLYRGEDDKIYTMGAELPFSQIMEITGVSEEAECDLALALTGAECTLAPAGEGRVVSVELEVMAQAVIREPRTLELLTDAYSTRKPLAAEWSGCPIDKKLDRGVRSQTVREGWDTPVTLREITDCRMAVGQVTQEREGDRLIMNAQVELQVLAVDEEGECASLQHTVTVPCPLELPDGCQCLCRCEGVGDVYASPAAGGVEVRFTLDFRYCAVSRRQITFLSGIYPGEASAEAGEQPSLVLRMLEEGERLWDVAKAYGTTIMDIISVNEMEDESAGVGKLLLIPRKR